MKKFIATIALVLAACSPAATQDVKTITKDVIDVGLAICLAEHAAIQDFAALKTACQWADALDPVVQNLLSAQKRGLAAASKAGVCSPSTGGK